MVAGACHCGAVTFTLNAVPTRLNDCGCSICRRYAALWAYYRPADVRLQGATEIYMWGERSIEFHRCKTCGCVTHWAPADKSYQRMGINARLLEPSVLAAIPVEHTSGPP